MDYSKTYSAGSKFNSRYNTNTPPYYKNDGNKSFSKTNESEFISKALNSREAIIISNNLIQNEDWETLGSHISRTQSISNIELSGININGFGLRSLADAIQRSGSIKSLKLEWNYLNEYTDDFDYFCDVISNASSLIYIYLNNNKLGYNQSNSVAKIIRNSSSVMYIDLRWNDLGNEGAKIILQNLAKNNTLQELNLMGNKVSNDLINDITEKIAKNKNYAHKTYLNEDRDRADRIEKSTKRLAQISLEERNNDDREYNYYTLTQKEENAVNIIEKEKNISEEMKARYDVQLITNSKLEKRIKELELMLNNEKAKFEEFKNECSKDLDIERTTKSKYEDMILRLKEDVMRKDVEINKLNIDFELKLGEVTQDKADATNENRLLTEKLERLKSTYEEKYRILEDNFKKNTQAINYSYDMLKLENEKLRREYSEDVKNYNLEFEKKLLSFEESYKQLAYKKEETDKENMYLKKEVIDLKMSKELEYKEREGRLLDEEARKFDSTLKNFEHKLKVLEAGREEAFAKNQSLQDELHKLRKNYTEKEIEYENKLNNFVIEKSTLQKSNSNLSSENKKLLAEISIKETQINKFKHDINDLTKTNEQLSSSFNDKLEEVKGNYFMERKLWEREKNDLKLNAEETSRQVESLKLKIAKIESDDIKHSETLKKTFVKMIDDSFKEKYKI